MSIIKMVLVVRMDIGMGQGKIASQCAHAAVECFTKARRGFLSYFTARAWLMMGQPKIVLKVQTEKEFLRLYETAQKSGLVTAAIRDAGRTQLKPGTITVLGIGPGATEKIDEITSHLRLL
ncbi:unnamed protein product [Trichogramma brassicae]|uniref:peptidyl-tRNA hydrolase n=2 Tax=Trichogramma TaxID=7490 RepID=A0A6H5IVR3_9HYME|nr:peptidyl-tRNA hydrolase 2, mitochondrial-like [Trichogramma pretiosum]CAB0039810.1 unnamed protein product [Trichogramma brassicae]